MLEVPTTRRLTIPPKSSVSLHAVACWSIMGATDESGES